jgi:hypothetical protein
MSRIFSSAEPGPQLTWTAMIGKDLMFRNFVTCAILLWKHARVSALHPGSFTYVVVAHQRVGGFCDEGE